jgi:glycosyltransferase involved in cell wall biosynthesis
MALALLQLASDPARRRALGGVGQARVMSSFSIEQSAQALQESYAKLGNRRRP